MALFKNRILAGSIKIFANGIRCALTITATPAAITSVNVFTTGPMTTKPNRAKAKPRRPAEKLLTSISKPARTLS